MTEQKDVIVNLVGLRKMKSASESNKINTILKNCYMYIKLHKILTTDYH